MRLSEDSEEHVAVAGKLLLYSTNAALSIMRCTHQLRPRLLHDTAAEVECASTSVREPEETPSAKDCDEFCRRASPPTAGASRELSVMFNLKFVTL